MRHVFFNNKVEYPKWSGVVNKNKFFPVLKINDLQGCLKGLNYIMRTTVRFKDYLKKKLKNPEFKKAFDEEEIYASLAIQIAKIRQKKEITQRELAKRLHTTQQTVSRLEDIHNRSYSLSTLIKIAQALDKHLKVELV